MRMIISLSIALVLTLSPFLELGTVMVNAKSLRNAQLSLQTTAEDNQVSNQEDKTASLEESKEENSDSTDGVSDESLNQETEEPLDEVIEFPEEEQLDQEAEMPKEENSDESGLGATTSTDEGSDTTEEDVIIGDGTTEEDINDVNNQPESQLEVETEISNQTTVFETKNNKVATGTLEFDIYFPTPLSQIKGINLTLKKMDMRLEN